MTDVFVWFQKGPFSQKNKKAFKHGWKPGIPGSPKSGSGPLAGAWLGSIAFILAGSEVRISWNVGTCRSWKLVAGGVIAALMRVWICPSLCGALCVLSNWILKIQRYCFLYSGILFEGQNSNTLDFSCNHIFTYNDYNSCCQRNELNTWYQILIPCSFFWLCSFEPQATLLKGNCLEWSWVSIDPNSKPFSSNKMTSVCMYLYICSLV